MQNTVSLNIPIYQGLDLPEISLSQTVIHNQIMNIKNRFSKNQKSQSGIQNHLLVFTEWNGTNGMALKCL